MNIKRKIETLFAQYLGTIAALDDITICRAFDTDPQTFPLLVVQCRNCPRDEDLPPGENEYRAELWIQVTWQIDDEAATPAIEDQLSEIEGAMRDTAAMMALMNYPGDGEEDTREAQGFHLKAVHEVGQDGGGTEERTHVEDISYTVLCCDFDVDP